MLTARLNLHHLYYFWAVAKDGHLTRTAERLRVSQSALSAQIRQLEAQLGQALFVRARRRLTLTEAGQLALGYADNIFTTESELRATLRSGRRREDVLRVGAVATLSRNFQESFVTPLLGQRDVRLSLESGALDGLLARLASHALDVVLANRPPPREPGPWRCRQIARQAISLVGHRRRRAFRFPDDLRDTPLILPGAQNEVRGEFEALCERLGIQLRVIAEVDDMAMMRLLARDTDAVALVPSVVVRDELKTRVLHEYAVVPGLFETFYAVTVARDYQHPLLRALLARDGDDILAMPSAPHRGSI